ncbi:hypothetical protein TNCV_3872071 [Trichonephila clavipes]|nr:hypothetical protein TNCV_3872071 [Trichonephila clavipes]
MCIQTENYSITPRTDKILIRNSKINQSNTSTDLQRNLLDYVVEVSTSTVRKSVLKVSLQRIKWAGHAVRMDEDRTTKKSLQCPINWHMEKRQAKSKMDGWPGKRSIILKTKNWRTLAGRRLAWKRFLEANVHPGM